MDDADASRFSTDSRLLNPQDSVLLVVDIQQKFAATLDDWERLVSRAGILVQACAQLEIPVLLSEQYPKGLGHTEASLAECLPQNAVLFEKTAFGCGGLPDFQAHLAALNRKQIMVCGLEAHICVNQTVHELLAAQYQVHLIQDAIASRHKRDFKAAMAKMQQSGAIPSCVEMALFELLGSAVHPAFKSVQSLIK